MYRMLATVVAVALLSTAPTPARGDGWPAPAAGLTRTGRLLGLGLRSCPKYVFTLRTASELIECRMVPRPIGLPGLRRVRPS